MRIPSTTPGLVPPAAAAASGVDLRPIAVQSHGTLALQVPDRSGRTFVSAASGIVAAGGTAWVVSDEYGELAHFPRPDAPGTLSPGLVAGVEKPDLESIVRLPALDGGAGSTLLALGSSNSHARDRGVVQRLDASGEPQGAPAEVDLHSLYKAFKPDVAEHVNIEGATWRAGKHGPELLLFHRGRAADDHNVVFTLDGDHVLKALRAGEPLDSSLVKHHEQLDLGTLDGVPLGISDARALPDGRIAFTASAEGPSATPDGEIRGSAIGILDSKLGLTELHPVSGTPRKIEGIERSIEFDPHASPDSYVVVTDPDDPAKHAELLLADLG
jgi:hypothetical protein